jgi:hypothetical protein
MIDAAMIDSAPDIDAPKEIDAALPVFKGFDADEGGEVRTEYVKFPTGGLGTRTIAYFFKNPGSIKYHDFLNTNGCTDMRDLTKWPMAMNPISEREYYDIGSSVVIVGGPAALSVPKRAAMARDPFYREHPAGGSYFDALASTDSDGPTFLSEKTTYDVVLPGSATFPGQIYDNAIYMPAAFDLNDTNHPHAGPLAFPADTDQTFTWTMPTDTPPAGVTIFSLVGFTGANGPAVLCVEPNDGSITVPAAMMNIARTAYPTGGSVARQTFAHQVQELRGADGKPTGRRVDFVGVWCYAGTTYTAP